ncbi:MAG: nitrous oxide-stimulated promoter family protein [bacterium]|nr:nitrous oxide-stimulated promoter family protein [bacterium]
MQAPTPSPRFQSARMRREARTVELMINRYCRDHHAGPNPCPDCTALLDYALARLKHCPFQEGKSTCGKCPIHCYSPEKRSRIREVMRYAGPRLIWTHPWLSIMHLVDGMRPARKKE